MRHATARCRTPFDALIVCSSPEQGSKCASALDAAGRLSDCQRAARSKATERDDATATTSATVKACLRGRRRSPKSPRPHARWSYVLDGLAPTWPGRRRCARRGGWTTCLKLWTILSCRRVQSVVADAHSLRGLRSWRPRTRRRATLKQLDVHVARLLLILMTLNVTACYVLTHKPQGPPSRPPRHVSPPTASGADGAPASKAPRPGAGEAWCCGSGARPGLVCLLCSSRTRPVCALPPRVSASGGRLPPAKHGDTNQSTAIQFISKEAGDEIETVPEEDVHAVRMSEVHPGEWSGCSAGRHDALTGEARRISSPGFRTPRLPRYSTP